MNFVLEEAQFIRKLNRFLCTINVQGEEHLCHIPNTGRLRELLYEGNTVYVKRFHQSGSQLKSRKTQFELSLALKENCLYSVDSRVPNALFKEWLDASLLDHFGKSIAKGEQKFENSRFDFLLSGDFNGFVEVKGVTLEKDAVGFFPDAPSERAVKHLHELIHAKEQGLDAAVVFICQSEMIKSMKPNSETDPKFSECLKGLPQFGVDVKAYNCKVSLDGIHFISEIPVIL